MKKSIVILISFIVSFIAIYDWFYDGSFMFFWDSYVPIDVHNSFQHLYFYWHENIFPGFESAGWSWLLYWAFIAAGQKILGSLSLSQGALYFILLSFSVTSFYFFLSFLATQFTSDQKLRFRFQAGLFVFAVMYTFNLFTFYYGYFMFNPDIFIFSFLPLNILSLLHIFPVSKSILTSNKMRWLFLFFISSFLMSPGFSVYVFLAQYYIWLAVYLFMFWFFLRRNALQLLFFFLLNILIHWWWFFPSLLGFKDLYNAQSVLGTTIWFERGFTPSRLLNSMRLIGIPLMASNMYRWGEYFTKNIWFTFPLFIIPLLIVYLTKKIGPWKKNIITYYFFIIFVCSLFLVKFSNPPLADITKFAFEHLPFFGAFRDSYQKAGIYYMFSMFSLAGIGFMYLLQSLQHKRFRVAIMVLYACLGVAALITTSPFFLFRKDNIRSLRYTYKGETYVIRAKTRVPPEYSELKRVLEPECKRTAVAVVPRSAWISSANWSKYGTSYVGQDFFARTINCQFLTSVILNSQSEASIEAPYHFLRQNDIASFKRYLRQQGIGIVLIRKDYVPYFPTSWLYKDAQEVKALFDKDKDFELFFENEYTVTYRLFNPTPNRQYGFSLTSTAVFTNSTLSSGYDFATLSRQVNTENAYIAVNTKNDYNSNKGNINMFAPIINCIGCVETNVESFLVAFRPTVMRVIKNYVKKIIRWNSKYSKEEQLSYSMIDLQHAFLRLLDSLKDTDIDKANKRISEYALFLESVSAQVRALSGEFFTKNQKFMEAHMFLESQHVALTELLKPKSDQKEHILTSFKDEDVHTQLYYLAIHQDELLSYVNKLVFATNFRKNEYKGRLDVPVSGLYNCAIRPLVSGVNIISFTLGENVYRATESGLSVPIQLAEGSSPVSIFYTAIVNDTARLKETNPGSTLRTELSGLSTGTYKLQFRFPSALSGRFAVVITNGEIFRSLVNYRKNTDDWGNQVIFSEIPVSSELVGLSEYEHIFSLQSLEHSAYYMYVVPLDGLTSGRSVMASDIQNIRISSIIQERDIEFACSYKKEIPYASSEIAVDKRSPALYYVTLPKNYQGKFLVFNQTYSDEWEAWQKVRGATKKLPHFKSGYENAWLLEGKGDGIIEVHYKRQRVIETYAIISIVVFVVAIFAYSRRYQ